ncbi:MAG: MBL fold metallo-hydrolase, partial [Candidatus Shapirobacteria bacterium]
AFKLKHNIPLCLGYLFKEKSKIKFYEEKAKKVGLKGQQFTEIQNKGKLKIDNKVIKLSDISYTKEGKKIVFVADTLPIDTAIKYSKDADLLIHEATYLSSLEKEAKENFHSTAKQAAEIAKKANVKKLLLFHISQRHKNPQELEKEAKKVFKNTICSKDGLVLEI